MNEGSLFVYFVYHIEFTKSQHLLLCSSYLKEKSHWWARVHQIGFIMFQPTMEKLLNIEKKIHWNKNKL
jgi:hypothetical protein